MSFDWIFFSRGDTIEFYWLKTEILWSVEENETDSINCSMVKRKQVSTSVRSVEEDADFELLDQVFNLLEIKDSHNLSESALVDILYHYESHFEVDQNWPQSFDEVLSLLKRTGYVDPRENTFRFCAGKDHVTVFYPEGISTAHPFSYRL
jgi:hypothetical protein